MSRAHALRIADRLTLLAMVTGLALLLQPWWSGGVAAGFFVTLGGTLAQIVVGHLPRGGPPRADAQA